MNQALAFGLLLAGGVTLEAGLTGKGLGAVLQGKAGAIPRAGSTLSVAGAGSAIATAAQVNAATGASTGPVAGTSVPDASWNPLKKPIANWIIPILDWASRHGWTGTVTSGFRTEAAQAQINASGAFSAPAGSSNHESTAYPGGAVDVTNPTQLIQVLAGYTGADRLIGGVLGAVDAEHFSATGH
jgi:hypothetical protein